MVKNLYHYLVVVTHDFFAVVIAVCSYLYDRLCCRFLGDPPRLQLRLRHVFPPFRWHVIGSALAFGDNYGILILNIKGVANDLGDLIGLGVFLARFCGRSCSAHFVSVSPRPIGGHRPNRLPSSHALVRSCPRPCRSVRLPGGFCFGVFPRLRHIACSSRLSAVSLDAAAGFDSWCLPSPSVWRFARRCAVRLASTFALVLVALSLSLVAPPRLAPGLCFTHFARSALLVAPSLAAVADACSPSLTLAPGVA